MEKIIRLVGVRGNEIRMTTFSMLSSLMTSVTISGRYHREELRLTGVVNGAEEQEESRRR